jgi:hypothetical protein
MLWLGQLGDGSAPPATVQGYKEHVRKYGKGALLRTAFSQTIGHCRFTTGDVVAAVTKLQERLDTERFGNTTANALNELAAQLHPSGGSLVTHNPPKYNRPYFLDSTYP